MRDLVNISVDEWKMKTGFWEFNMWTGNKILKIREYRQLFLDSCNGTKDCIVDTDYY